MKRKILSFGIILCMLIGLVVVPVMAAEVNGLCGDDLIWVFNSNGTLAISGTGDMKNYNPYYSAEVPWNSLYLSIKTVLIGDGVTSIGTFAFNGCRNLTQVTIPNSVISIGLNAFYGCSSLTQVTIPNGVTSISTGAFYGCSSLRHVTIPNSVTSIGDTAFGFCDSLTAINVSGNNQNYSSQDGVLFNKNKTTIVCCPGGMTGEYTLPDSVTDIIEGAFNGCRNLTQVTIPNGVTSIWHDVFSACSSLMRVAIPDSVTSIGNYAFYACSSLTDVYYGGREEDWNSISIGSYNSYLTSATIHYNHISSKKLNNVQDYDGNKLTILENGILDIGEELYFRSGYVDASKGYIKTGDRKITGSNIYFTSEGKIRLDDGYNAKIERDNGDGTTNQGFIFGKYNPSGIIKVILDVTGEAGGVDYTGKTIEKDFDFTCSEIYGLANFGFEIANIPKPIEFYVHED